MRPALTLILVALSGIACAIDYTVGSGTSGGSGESEGIVCPEGQLSCGERCIDPSADPSHCGVCGNDCGDSECVMGACEAACTASCDGELEVCSGDACLCRSGLQRCGEGCVDTTNDPEHCGGCGVECDGDACGASVCRPSACEGFAGECDGSCVDFDSDPLHCGECEARCESDELCVSGECREASASACDSCPCEECGAALCCSKLVDGAIVCIAEDSCEGEGVVNDG